MQQAFETRVEKQPHERRIDDDAENLRRLGLKRNLQLRQRILDPAHRDVDLRQRSDRYSLVASQRGFANQRRSGRRERKRLRASCVEKAKSASEHKRLPGLRWL